MPYISFLYKGVYTTGKAVETHWGYLKTLNQKMLRNKEMETTKILKRLSVKYYENSIPNWSGQMIMIGKINSKEYNDDLFVGFVMICCKDLLLLLLLIIYSSKL